MLNLEYWGILPFASVRKCVNSNSKFQKLIQRVKIGSGSQMLNLGFCVIVSIFAVFERSYLFCFKLGKNRLGVKSQIYEMEYIYRYRAEEGDLTKTQVWDI